MRRVLFSILPLMLLGMGSGYAGPIDSNSTAVLALHVTGKVKNFGCAATQANPTQNTLAVLPADYVTHWSQGIPYGTLTFKDVFVWLMVANADQTGGIDGISCGVDWALISATRPGTEMRVAWTRCSDLEFPSGGWPAPGGGNRITWTSNNCQRKQPLAGKVTACAGWFTLSANYGYYAPYLIDRAFIRLTQNLNVPVPELAIANCSAVETQLPTHAVGWVGFGPEACPGPDCTLPGCNPYLGPCDAPIPVRETTWGRLKQQFGGDR